MRKKSYYKYVDNSSWSYHPDNKTIRYVMFIEGNETPVLRFILRYGAREGKWYLKETSKALSNKSGKESCNCRRIIDNVNPIAKFDNISEIKADILVEVL